MELLWSILEVTSPSSSYQAEWVRVEIDIKKETRDKGPCCSKELVCLYLKVGNEGRKPTLVVSENSRSGSWGSSGI